MANAFSVASESNLATCHEDLQQVARSVLRVIDCSVIEGYRGKKQQNEYFDQGLSQLQWPESKHNQAPATAMHLVPYPIEWEGRDARDRFHYFAGFVRCRALSLGISLRWGGDWDGDWQTRDNNFDDLAHYELIGGD